MKSFSYSIAEYLSISTIFKIILLVCVTALGFAYSGEYVYGFKPCTLCTYQRYLYGLTGLLAVFGLLTKKLRMAIFALFGSAFLFFANCGVAIYQVLVEKNFLSPPSVCQGISIQTKSQSFEQFKESFSQAGNHIPCNVVNFEIFGISMAGYNAFFTFCCGLFFLILAMETKRSRTSKARSMS